jgi:hypothetical protein
MRARAIAPISLLALWSCGGSAPAGPTQPTRTLQSFRITVPSNVSAQGRRHNYPRQLSFPTAGRRNAGDRCQLAILR